MGNLLKGIQTATLKKDTRSLCGTKHTVKAEATGPTAGKDTILVSYKLESTSGWLKTDYHTGDGYLHKIRITIFKDGEIAYQQDVAGDDSGKFITLPPFLITNEGKWEITAKSIAAGDCAKPTGEKNFGYLYAKQPEPVEEDNQETTVNPNDLTPILSVGMIGLAGLVFSKILRKERKDAETFEAPKTPNYKKVMEIIKQILYEPNSEQYKLMQEWNPEHRRLHQIWLVYTYCQLKNQIPNDVKQRKISSQMRWLRRNWKGMANSEMLNAEQFTRGFKMARDKYGVNYEQEGFHPIPTNWIIYDGKIFYYATPGLLDKTAIITGTEVYSIKDGQAKEAFNSLEKEKKKALLKKDKKAFF